MFSKNSEAIFDLIRRRKVIPLAELESHREEAAAKACSLAEILIEHGVFDQAALLQFVAKELGLSGSVAVPEDSPREWGKDLSLDTARKYLVVPLRNSCGSVDLLTGNPFDWEAADDLSFVLEKKVRWFAGDPNRISLLVHRPVEGEASTADPLQALSEFSPVENSQEISTGELQSLVEQGPVVNFVDLILRQAVNAQASDVHLEPFENEFKIRYRIDGVLSEMTPPPTALALPITSRLKVLANLDIAERRLPQDGRIAYSHQGHAVDFRISTLPTQYGESVVLRVLDQKGVQLDLAELGLPANLRFKIEQILTRPNGLFIVTGPTGSGKTTTLYGALRRLNSSEKKLLTAEDPVEYEIEGVTQVPVNVAAGLTFADVLRSFLRQDPDVIMVGEIRDAETAAVAVQASLTGHLVLSTLHTNDAPAAVTRLVDMGVEPFLIASSLEGVLAQRLVRRICPRCRCETKPTDAALRALGFTRSEWGDQKIFRGEGCEHCGHTGYRGRMGLFELLLVSDPIRELITGKASVAELRDLSVKEGMTSLRDEGLRAIFAGETTIDEVISCT